MTADLLDVLALDVRAEHPLRYPLERCPACDSEHLEAVVEVEMAEVHFLCRGCRRCWHVAFGRVHRMAPHDCHSCARHSR